MSSWITNDPRDETWLNKLITQLKIIGRIEPGDKIYTEKILFCIETPSLTRGMRRMMYGEGRVKNIQRINDVVGSLVKYIDENHSKMSSDEEKQLISRCFAAMSGSLLGLRNLSSSYGDDACALAQIECIIERIENFVRRHHIDPEPVSGPV